MPRPKLPHPPSTVHPKVRKAAKKYGELGNANKLKGLDQEKVFESKTGCVLFCLGQNGGGSGGKGKGSVW